MHKYAARNPPISAKIGALVARNAKGSLRLDASSLLVEFVFLVPEGIVKLID